MAEYVGDTSHHGLTDPLPATALWAMYGGVAAYLIAHLAFRLRNVGSINRPRAVVALVVLLAPLVTGVIRSTFVIDADGTVEHALYNVKATGHVAKLRRDLGLD